MISRSHFSEGIAQIAQTHVDRAIAFLWYLHQVGEFEEVNLYDLAEYLQEEGFPKPRPRRLREYLIKSKYTIVGKGADCFKLDRRHLPELDEKYLPLIDYRPLKIDNHLIDSMWVSGTREYLEKMVDQINGCYQMGFYDGSAVLCRRLMETLIIECYIARNREPDIKTQEKFLGLDALINKISQDKTLSLSRHSPSSMKMLKEMGDFAAHDRVYITTKADLDSKSTDIRRLIRELLSLSNIRP